MWFYQKEEQNKRKNFSFFIKPKQNKNIYHEYNISQPQKMSIRFVNKSMINKCLLPVSKEKQQQQWALMRVLQKIKVKEKKKQFLIKFT